MPRQEDAMPTRVEAAINAAKAGNAKAATDLLARAVKDNPRDARAWYLLSQVETDNARAQECVRKVLEIAPDNQQAKDRLVKLVAEGERFEEIEIAAPVQRQIVRSDPITTAQNVALSISTIGTVLTAIGILAMLFLCLVAMGVIR
jgi:tetratricopeptide (TPR) repeat protein